MVRELTVTGRDYVRTNARLVEDVGGEVAVPCIVLHMTATAPRPRHV